MADHSVATVHAHTLAEIQPIADFLLARTKYRPTVASELAAVLFLFFLMKMHAVICGSGLGDLADAVEQPDVFEYHDIPGFPISTGSSAVGLFCCCVVVKIPNRRK